LDADSGSDITPSELDQINAPGSELDADSGSDITPSELDQINAPGSELDADSGSDITPSELDQINALGAEPDPETPVQVDAPAQAPPQSEGMLADSLPLDEDTDSDVPSTDSSEVAPPELPDFNPRKARKALEKELNISKKDKKKEIKEKQRELEALDTDILSKIEADLERLTQSCNVDYVNDEFDNKNKKIKEELEGLKGELNNMGFDGSRIDEFNQMAKERYQYYEDYMKNIQPDDEKLFTIQEPSIGEEDRERWNVMKDEEINRHLQEMAMINREQPGDFSNTGGDDIKKNFKEHVKKVDAHINKLIEGNTSIRKKLSSEKKAFEKEIKKVDEEGPSKDELIRKLAEAEARIAELEPQSPDDDQNPPPSSQPSDGDGDGGEIPTQPSENFVSALEGSPVSGPGAASETPASVAEPESETPVQGAEPGSETPVQVDAPESETPASVAEPESETPVQVDAPESETPVQVDAPASPAQHE